MVTGGDALMRIAGGRGTWTQDAFTVNGKAATVKNQFHRDGPAASGALTGLPLGKSTLEDEAATRRRRASR